MKPGPRRRLVWPIGAALICACLVALGSWQVQRLAWKRDLIARVEQRVHAAPVAAPGLERWAQLTAASDEYRHVRVAGTWRNALTTRVQASTELGSGFWLLTPLCRLDGSMVLVNRGFVKPRAQDWKPAPAQIAADQACVARADNAPGELVIDGLLRMSEPGGAFLRHNDPLANRWYSRDVDAIAAARRLRQAAPYFIDADAAQAATEAPFENPVGGLTVISFPNHHLVYALTWYALALMAAGAGMLMTREQWKPNHGKRQ